VTWGAVLAALSALLLNEFSEISPWAGRQLARYAATLRYGRCERARTRAEEWSALLNERPGKLIKLLTGLRFFLDSLPRAAWRLMKRSSATEMPLMVIPDVPHQSLSLRQTAALLTLMAIGRADVTNRELRASYGTELTGNDRKALNDLGLVSTRKHGPTLVHELTEEGWAHGRS
jgi:hypothetical protein